MPRWQHKGAEHRNWQPDMDRTPSGQNRDVKRKYQASPRGRYVNQRMHAKQRGIQFLLTFDEWWSIWKLHWDRRGNTSNSLVMSRKNDRGAYEVGNVELITNRANRLQQKENGTTRWH